MVKGFQKFSRILFSGTAWKLGLKSKYDFYKKRYYEFPRKMSFMFFSEIEILRGYEILKEANFEMFKLNNLKFRFPSAWRLIFLENYLESKKISFWVKFQILGHFGSIFQFCVTQASFSSKLRSWRNNSEKMGRNVSRGLERSLNSN